MTESIYYRVVVLPDGIHSLCRKSPDGSYTILVNANDPDYTWLRHYQHELQHIRRNDHDSDEAVQKIEATVHIFD